MVVCESSINNIMGGIENTGGVTLHNHRRKLKQRFDIIKKLGQGTYGKVQLGINKETGQEVAIKTIKKCKIETEADLIRIRREIQIMSSVQHPNIIHIYEVFENREKMVLVMEYAAGGELYDYLSERKVLSEDEARRIFRQISTAVYYCHKHKICHRDLKLENILLDENGSAKIADFGLSNVFDDRRLLSTFCGSPLYASPEIVKGTPYHGPEVDCWSLGVLLYTLVYGAMPFDGSNFKRLVRQISQGDYFEPRKPSSASPLIREMLTVVPEKRANIENICAHWWVNANYDESCLEIAEDLANQTPVRLDLLLSLAPPPPQVGSDQLVIAGESSSMTQPVAEASTAPARSQSVGSLMELVPAAERRIRDLVDENKSPKRKLEVTVSTENANMSGAKRKEKLTKKPEVDVPSNVMNEEAKLCKNLTQTLVREEQQPVEMAAENSEDMNEIDPNLQGAACTELIEESKKNEAKEKMKSVKIIKKKTEKPSTEAENKTNDKENKDTNTIEQIEAEKKDDTKIPKRKIIVKKKSTKEKTEDTSESATVAVKEEQQISTENKIKSEEPSSPPTKPVERRRSKIFETAEKFQSLVTNNDSKSSVLEKPKKIFIPGVNVGGFKKEFERKASLTSTVAPDLKKIVPKKTIPANKTEDVPSAKNEEATSPKEIQSPEPEPVVKQEIKEVETIKEAEKIESPANNEELKKKNAVNIISNAITKEGTRKSKSKPCMMRKPPVPFGINGRSASGSIGLPVQFSPCISKSPELASPEENNVTSSAEITLKSATLPRRKTTKAEIKLDYPPPRPATMEFKTEMAHRIEGRPELKTQRSEIIVPVNNNSNNNNNNVTNNRIRSTSLDPEIIPKESPKERIIPISFERDDTSERSDLQSPQAKPPMPKPFPVQRPIQRFGSLSRQSTHDSDSEATISENMEPIRKSPREYIIPIAVEGGGYVTPRATSLEPSDTSSGISSGRRSMPRFGRSKRVGENGSEEDLSFSSLHRHNSVGRDSDNEDSRREPFHMHRLRSSRPTRKENLEHADSLSSGEEDDDDGFEILTAENLFTTLLSRVRSLTQRINVEDNGRLGFPNSRLLGNFDHGSKLWNLHNDNLSRFSPFHREQSSVSSSNNTAPWRRSVSRDLASDIERVFNNTSAGAGTPTPTATATTTATLPRDKSKKSKSKEANKYDLNELKLTDEDALALSYLTPGLSRRIQNQLFSQLPTLKRDRSRKLSQNSTDSIYRTKDYPYSDSSDSELFSSDKYKHDNGNDDILNEYNFPRPPPKHSYSSSRASEYSPIAESPIMENKFPVNKVEPKIYRLEDIKKSYDKDKIEGFTKYTPYRHCYRSTSLIEPNTSNSYSNPIYFRNSNFSSENFDSKYNSENKTNLGGTTSKYNSRPYLTSHSDETQDALALIRPVSRFGKPDYFDNCVYTKERQKREMETQKVLKEIRNKRINEHRDKYRTRDNSNSRINETIENGNHDQKTIEISEPPKEKPILTNNDVKEEIKPIKREGKISKLIRPKSYPAENVDTVNKSEIKTNGVSPEKTIKSKLFKRNTDKSSPAKDLQNTDDKKSNNQFLSSIEKKIRSLYSESPPPVEKNKIDSPSRVQNTIRSLREQSEPRNIEHCVTESGLIKRAVSSEDFSVFGTNKPNTKTLQPSRKSVSKILGLFKKYEDKQPKSKNTEETSKKGKTDDPTKKKIKAEKTKTNTSKNKKECTCNVNETIVKKSNSKTKNTSKLPVSSNSRNSSVESETNLINQLENDNKFVPISDLSYKPPDRKELKLNLNKTNDHPSVNDFLNVNREQNLPLFSPCDESNDSWSVCSDMHRQDMSPMSDNKLFSEEEANESVIDRIRRKSFYCRFNEKKKPRKTSLVDNRYDYTKYDKYADLPNNAIKSRSLKDCATDQKSYGYTAPSTKEPKLCKRALSMNDNYHKYGGSKSNSNFNLSPEDKLLDAIDKNLNPKSKKSYLKTPTRFSDRITKSPPLNGNVGEGSSNNDVSAPL